MCGIMAVKGKLASDLVIAGLKKLEYRGYDSCGIGCKIGDDLKVFRAVGYIDNLEKTEAKNIESNLAIGHTRWATHGGVEIKNSHPHSSADGKFIIVHNGIIENYKEIKNRILPNNFFVSDTDSEVIAHLIEYYYDGNVWEAFTKAIADLTGSFAIVMINSYDDLIYFARRSSPLIISKSSNAICLASDIGGIGNKSNICIIPDNSIGHIDSNIQLFDNNYNTIDLVWKDYSELNYEIDKGGYPHYMLKEIMEIPKALKSTYETFKASTFKLPSNISNVLIIGCGTSYHSGLMICKYIGGIAKIRAECKIASEFIYNDYLLEPNTLAVFISQSGETADTLSALRRAKSLGIYTIAITNVRGSSITNLANETIYIDVGAEVCVASTKAYTSQVLCGLLISFVLLALNNSSDIVGGKYVEFSWNKVVPYLLLDNNELGKLFNIDISDMLSSVKGVSEKLQSKTTLHLIGKDYDYITAMEGALKIKEVSYTFTDAYPCGELKHGTLSLIDDDSYVIAIVTSDGILLDKTKNAMHEISARGGRCIVVSHLDKEYFAGDFVLRLPKLDPLLMPIVSIIPIDLIAYEISTSRGINPDKPRNLAKSVTVE